MPLPSEPALLKEQGGGNSMLSGRSSNQDPHFDSAATETPYKPSGCAGFCAGVVEAVGLFCTVPGFWRLAACAWCTSAGTTLPSAYYINSLQSTTWGTDSPTYSSLANAGQFGIAIFGAPLFASWSDGRPRKTAMTIGATMTLVRYVPLLFDGWFLDSYQALDCYVVTLIISASFVGQVSGSPVFWAWMTDTLPQEHRETGFSLIFALAALGTWLTGTIVNQIVQTYELDGKWFLWIGVVILFLQIFVVLSVPHKPAIESDEEEDPDPMSRQRGLVGMLLSPLRLVARKRSLRIICGFAAFVTLPDVAVTYTAVQLVIPMQSAAVYNNSITPLEQLQVANWFSNFPNIFLIALYTVVGVCSKRFGPARFLSIWTPITSVLFAAPALLQWVGGDAWLCFTGVLMLSPVSIYPPLQAIVALLVPPSRVGEAMGAVSAFKNIASLIAPLAMSAITEALASNNRTDLYWTLFPLSALIMLAGAWPFSIMLARRVGHDTDVEWSVWSSVSMSVTRRSGADVRHSSM